MNTNKLILLSGPPGIGKSTLSQRYVDDHPMALNLDIDRIWQSMGQWQEQRPQSHVQKMRLAYCMAERHLEDGYDVAVAQHLDKAEYYERFEGIACATNSLFFEVLLCADLDSSIERCIIRGQKSGYADGFRPGGVLDTGGREEKLKEMYHAMMVAAEARPNIIHIEPDFGDIEGTYRQLTQAVTVF